MTCGMNTSPYAIGMSIAVDLVVLQELIAQQAVSRGVAIVLAVDRRDAEAPVDVILLDRVGQPLEIDDRLIELDRIRVVIIGRRRIAAARPCCC